MTRTDLAGLLRAVAAHSLPGATEPFPPRPLAGATWEQLLGGVRSQRLAGHLLHAIAAGDLPVTDGQHTEAAELHKAAMTHVLLLERRLLHVLEVFGANGVDYRVLKGAAYAHVLYPDPALRVYGDSDVLVPSRAWEAAVAALTGAGYRRRWPQPRAGFDRRFGKGGMFTDPQGYELDLHRTFVLGPFGLTVDLDELFTSSSSFEVGGRTLLALAPEARFLHTCYHAALGSVNPRLVPLRDVAQHLLAEHLDPDAVLEVARRWSAEAVVARAVSLTWRRLALADVVPLSVWARRYEPSAHERWALSTYNGPDHSYGAKTLAAVQTLPSMRDRAAFLYALLLPERDYLAARGTGYLRWWRRGWQALLNREQV